MHSRFDPSLIRAEVAEIAQLLRGGDAFGSVVFDENASFSSEDVQIEPGYSDCLPILGGGCWRDPASPIVTESLK